MEVIQVYNIVNEATSEIIGESSLLQEDLANVVDVGRTLENAGGLDAYVKKLPNVIGRMIWVDRKYKGFAPSVIRDGWEYGSLMMKVRGVMPEAEENESWELEDGASYDMGIFTRPDVAGKFFNKKVTFEIPISITEMQVKQSFHSPQELTAFISMLWNEVEKSMTVKMDALVMRTINNFTAETIYNGVGDDLGETSVRAINLLALYNAKHTGATITASEALSTPEFLRFATYIMGRTADRMGTMSKLFNMGGTNKFTGKEDLKCVLLSDFKRSIGVYLYDANGQYRTENLAITNADIVPFWQGSGTTYSDEDVTTINVKTVDGHEVNASGILGVMFDKDALAVCNESRRTTVAPYNAKGEFWNYWNKWDCSYFNDYDENFVVFFIHDEDE